MIYIFGLFNFLYFFLASLQRPYNGSKILNNEFNWFTLMVLNVGIFNFLKLSLRECGLDGFVNYKKLH